jgi:hypothetical protein
MRLSEPKHIMRLLPWKGDAVFGVPVPVAGNGEPDRPARTTPTVGTATQSLVDWRWLPLLAVPDLHQVGDTGAIARPNLSVSLSRFSKIIFLRKNFVPQSCLVSDFAHLAHEHA